MESKSQAKKSLVGLIKWKMKLKGIEDQKELAKLANVPTSNLSRFLKGAGLDCGHVYSILYELDLLNTPNFVSREIHNLYKLLAEERKINENILIQNEKLHQLINSLSPNRKISKK